MKKKVQVFGEKYIFSWFLSILAVFYVVVSPNCGTIVSTRGPAYWLMITISLFKLNESLLNHVSYHFTATHILSF